MAAKAVVFDTTPTSGSSLLTLRTPQDFAGMISGLAGDDAIDLANFASASTTNSVVAGTGARTTTEVTLTEGALMATLQLLNQYAGEFSLTVSTYMLSNESGPNHGALFPTRSPWRTLSEAKHPFLRAAPRADVCRPIDGVCFVVTPKPLARAAAQWVDSR